jgi:hypothetical protein
MPKIKRILHKLVLTTFMATHNGSSSKIWRKSQVGILHLMKIIGPHWRQQKILFIRFCWPTYINKFNNSTYKQIKSLYGWLIIGVYTRIKNFLIRLRKNTQTYLLCLFWPSVLVNCNLWMSLSNDL